jgi:hypothetical protein
VAEFTLEDLTNPWEYFVFHSDLGGGPVVVRNDQVAAVVGQVDGGAVIYLVSGAVVTVSEDVIHVMEAMGHEIEPE